MLSFIEKKINTITKINQRNRLKIECIKICLIYALMGFCWVYFSDKLANILVSNKKLLLLIHTYKGVLFIIITSVILYSLLKNLLKKINSAENKLNESYKQISEVNRELEAYVYQLTSSEEELREKYKQIIENEKKLSISEEKNSAIVKAIPDLLFIIDNEGNYIDCITNDESLLFLPRKDLIDKNILDIIPKEISEAAYKMIQSVLKSGEMQNFEYILEISGEAKWFEMRMVKNNEEQILAIIRDISKRKEMEYTLEYLSYHDQLTGLYNRRFFESELRRLDAECYLPLSIIMADVNGLKLVNDSFGHGTGDELLRKVVEVMKNGCREGDILARLAGDEFVILSPKTEAFEAEQIVKDIKALALKEKVRSVDISVSLGYETKNNIGQKIEEVLKKAEDHMYRKKLLESPTMRGKTVNAIITALHEKNKREEQHSHRTSELCESMGQVLGLPEDEIEELKTAGLLHDIGKIAIEENILNKEARLTEEEMQQIMKHPEIGYRILSTVNELSELAEYVLAHHERWDGTGYPKGLKGDRIPLQSRIIAIADSYDAMISKRSYRDALPEEVAINELKLNSGKKFDPKLTRIFIEKVLHKSFDKIYI
ncbi:HD domain-containing phosphohydrolase [Inconstantimicrobium mannanitabidum]|uniref:Uncharacterized protein n=1 Tax=Inconstantimicrobium mannanitabidum TaxID=1604901 RepID=A0ACB5R714_9CLOT|nr:HD domain-containing phosphohydrolase [Clostridium sp. TW13]GKX64979.1 hypothetical protein rsdtw13_02370 [Clostridium sp. TW13]